MRKSSTSGRGLTHELLDVQPVSGFHQDVEAQSANYSNGFGLDRDTTSARLKRPEAFSSIVYVSSAMDETIRIIERSRESSAPLLITGETGTGKELIARAVHALSPHRGKEFIPFNCGDAPPELITSELFGYRRGAFTGAHRDYKGVIREADGSTLFLDEIGELPLAAQTVFLRFLQEGEIRPLGQARPTRVNVRVIAATNRNLEADILSGQFRVDLYHRLNVFRVHVPPLRERREDIRPLMEHFTAQRLREMGKQRLRLSDEAWALMLGYHWPGNVREVENLSHRLVALAWNGEVIGHKSALDAIGAGICVPPPATVVVEGGGVIDINLPLHEALDKLKRLLIEHALKLTGGNRVQAAARLKIHRDGLKKMIDKLKIEVNRDDRRK